jgi:hypothetical protein
MPAPAVRVTVIGTRRADLVLPGAVPVAELLPVLACEVLEPEERYAGCRVMLPDGRMLVPDAGVVAQGVRDGAVLSLVAGVDPPVPPRYDNAAEAMAEAVARDGATWSPGAGTALAMAALCALVVVVAVAARIAGDRLATVFAGMLVAAALAPTVGPTVALASTRTGSHRWDERVDARRIAGDAALARERLLVLHGLSGALVVALAPVAAESGRWGTWLAVAAGVLTALRTRHQHAAAEVLAGLVAGGLGLLGAVATAVFLHPAARTAVALGATALAAVLLAARRRPGAAAWWWGRLGDALETLGVLASLPLFALEAGLVPGVPR